MSNRTNGSVVRQFEDAFVRYVGAKYAIAMCNGTATLHTALVALGVKPGDRVAVPPLTMASTTLAVLHVGAVVVYVDVTRDGWLMAVPDEFHIGPALRALPVSLYGSWSGYFGDDVIEDAAETLNPHRGAAFTSYSFQESKILSAGEGGMLVTDNPALAAHARSFARLGYPSGAIDEPLSDTWYIKHPDAKRHLMIGYNYRMADCQAALLLPQLERADEILAARKYSADCYRQAIEGCEWITPQYVPEGWPHSYWTYAIALRDKGIWEPFVSALVNAGAERPYAAWRVTYNEPAFKHLTPWKRLTVLAGNAVEEVEMGETTCPVAEDLQPRLVQLQTNHDKLGAEHAAECLKKAIASCGF